MLMTGSGKAARIHYLPGTFRLLTDGDHVVCAVTGTPSSSCVTGALSGKSLTSMRKRA